MDMKKYKFLLFDVDGTLLDFHAAENQALLRTFQMYHIPFHNHIKDIYEEINHRLWKSFEQGLIDKETVLFTRFDELFERLNIHQDGIQFEIDYQKELGKGHQLLPYALDIVKDLSQKYHLYIVTNGVSSTQYSRLQISGLDQYFIDIFVSEDAGYQKPANEYFDYCFQRIDGFDKEHALIIGDSLSSDILGGIHAGIDTCWIHDTTSCEKEIQPTYSITDLRQIYDILK